MSTKLELIICKNIFKSTDDKSRIESFTGKMAELIKQKESSKIYTVS